MALGEEEAIAEPQWHHQCNHTAVLRERQRSRPATSTGLALWHFPPEDGMKGRWSAIQNLQALWEINGWLIVGICGWFKVLQREKSKSLLLHHCKNVKSQFQFFFLKCILKNTAILIGENTLHSLSLNNEYLRFAKIKILYWSKLWQERKLKPTGPTRNGKYQMHIPIFWNFGRGRREKE